MNRPTLRHAAVTAVTVAGLTLAGLTLAGACAGTPARPTAGRPVADGSAAGTPEPTTAPATQPIVATSPIDPTMPAVTTRTVTVRRPIGYSTRKVDDGRLARGKTKVRTAGAAGVRTLTYEVTLTGGQETVRRLVSDVVTREPVTKVIAVGTRRAAGSD